MPDIKSPRRFSKSQLIVIPKPKSGQTITIKSVGLDFEQSLFNKHVQTILGNPPSKSNCNVIVTFMASGAKKGKPGKQRPRASLVKSNHLKKYEQAFYLQCDKYRNANIEGLFKFEMDVYYPTQRSDLDNSLKVVLDCLQKVHAFDNDNKCKKIIVEKYLDKENPRIEFTITKI